MVLDMLIDLYFISLLRKSNNYCRYVDLVNNLLPLIIVVKDQLNTWPSSF